MESMQATTRTVTITVLAFAAYREAIGSKELRLALPAGSTAAQAYRQLEGQAPALRALRPYTTFAVNREVVDEDAVLEEGDELALLQPVSGG